MNFIPPLDLTQQYQQIAEQVNAAVLEVLASGRYIGGPDVEKFEQAFADYIGVPECVSCNSGTDALFLALRAYNIGPGDQVITTPFTFFATAEVISAVGATPVFVDIDPHTYNLDVEKIPPAITERTRAILPVHLFGRPVDMTRLLEIAQNHQLIVIEDCAQATGATWQGQQVGSMGDIGCFSFFPTKNLGSCGDGGAITTRNPEIAQKVRMLKNHGQSSRYHYHDIGVNSRLDALQAAILLIKLQYLETWNQGRRQVAHRYQQLLTEVPGLSLPSEAVPGKSVWNQYTVRLLGSQSPGHREQVQTHLQSHGVSTMVYYPLPLHQQPVYHHLQYWPGQLPWAEQVSQEVLSLPMFPELSAPQQDQVIHALKTALT